jgi:hypothetical protein
MGHTEFNYSTIENRYSGRIFLIGSGPSLKETPLELLQDEYTFAANSIPDIFDKTDWRPSFYACVDDGVDIEYCKEAIDLGIPCFFPEKTSRGEPLVESVPSRDNILFFENIDLRDIDELNISTFHLDFDSINHYKDVWSEDINKFIYGYNTVMYQMMQISYYMGFDEIYLVGNDLYNTFDKYLLFSEASDPAIFQEGCQSTVQNGIKFLRASDRPIKSFCNAITYKTVKSRMFSEIYSHLSDYTNTLNQNNYFSKDYSSNGVTTHEKNQRHILAHKLAMSVSNELKFDIYNATMGGHLEVYPRVDLEDIVRSNKNSPHSV